MKTRDKVKEREETSSQVDRAVSQVLDQSMHVEKKWMEETAAAVFERENELNRKEIGIRRAEEEIRARERKLAVESKEIKDAQLRVRKLAEQLREKETRVKESERQYETELKNCKEAQSRVQQMAFRLKQKNEQIKEESQRLERRMAECDALEKHLQQWQYELEDGLTLESPRGEDGMGTSF